MGIWDKGRKNGINHCLGNLGQGQVKEQIQRKCFGSRKMYLWLLGLLFNFCKSTSAAVQGRGSFGWVGKSDYLKIQNNSHNIFVIYTARLCLNSFQKYPQTLH